jgi:protein-S-isoprenylcysteine O-methyltransferase Ste14
MINWAATPLDKPITSGLYQYSRHPMYITQNIVFIGVGIASASWLFLLLIILFFAAVSMLAPREERLCIKRYGDSYKWYMDKTSRWIGLPK